MPRPTLSPYTFTTFAKAQQYLKRPESAISDVHEDVVVMALNAVPGLFEGEVGRKLACRVYRSPVTIACTAAAADETLTAASGLTALKTLDDAVGTRLEPGSRVASITSGTSLELTKKAASAGSVSVTFGSEPLVLSGAGSSTIYLPVRPVVEVYSAKRVDRDGVKTALDTGGARLERETGRYVLTNDSFPEGLLNIEIEAKAGYREPTATELGDWDAWSQLESLCLRVVQVMFQDFDQQVGRTGEITLATATMKIQDFKLPDDIRDGLRRFREPW